MPFRDLKVGARMPSAERSSVRITREPLAPGLPRASESGPARTVRVPIPALVRFSLLVFVASIPFEATDVGLMKSALSPARLVGLLFFGVCAWLLPLRTFARPSAAVWCFIGYLTVYTIDGAFIDPRYRDVFVTRLITLIQLIVFLWVASKLLTPEKLTRDLLVVFASASGLLAIAVLLGLPGFSVSMESYMGERASALGFNPNDLAGIMAFALVSWIGLALSPGMLAGWSKAWAIACPLPLGALLVRTGSRGGILAFVLGVSLFLLPLGRSRRRLVAIFGTIVALNVFAYLIVRDPVTMGRFTYTLETGDTAHRDVIFESTVSMIEERPIVGWLPVECWWELGARTDSPWGVRDAHNLFLYVLMEVGLLGSIPFLLGVWLCARSAWRARLGVFGILPLSMLATVIGLNLSGTWITRKQMWLMFAVVLVVGSVVPHRRVEVVRRRLVWRAR